MKIIATQIKYISALPAMANAAILEGVVFSDNVVEVVSACVEKNEGENAVRVGVPAKSILVYKLLRRRSVAP